MIDLFILAGISFIQVFALGFQSRNVNNGNYVWAAGTSFFIGVSQAAVWRNITADDAGPLEAFVYGLSGSIAIVCAMLVHTKINVERKPNDQHS